MNNYELSLAAGEISLIYICSAGDRRVRAVSSTIFDYIDAV